MKSEKGMAYITVLVIIMILSALAISYSYMSGIEAKISYNKKDSDQAYYIAEAGLRKGIWRLLHDPDFKTNYNNVLFTENFGAGSYEYKVTKATYNPSVFVTSTGKVGNTNKVVKTHTYIVTIKIVTIAGNGTAGDTVGSPLSSKLKKPQSVAVDSAGNVYIADTDNHRIKKLIWDSGSQTYTSLANFAGTGAAGDTGAGGVATSAKWNTPKGVAVDSSGNVYIADSNSDRIKKVDTSGIITFIAGTGASGNSGDNGPATSAKFNNPEGVAVTSSGEIYVADTSNNRVRKFTEGGNISLFAGVGNNGYSGDGGAAISAKIDDPNSVAVDSSGNVYISDSLNDRIRKVAIGTNIITTVAGTGTAGYSGDSGAATSAMINVPKGIAITPAGNFFIGDSTNNRVRLVNGATGIITTYAGTGTAGNSVDNGAPASAQLRVPYGVAIDSLGNIYIADKDNHDIRKIIIQ